MANFQDLQQLNNTNDSESKVDSVEAEAAIDSAFDDVFEDEFVCTRKSSASSLQYSQSGVSNQQQQQQQRRCSQGSSGSSGGTPSSSNIYAIV
uniref:Uncharacterized protein n=1 Tax=Panagrolaimus sp. ES5 TaxID=591445 RepID=A0AC34GI43_9BILA